MGDFVAAAGPDVAVGGDIARLDGRERRAIAPQDDLIGAPDADRLGHHPAGAPAPEGTRGSALNAGSSSGGGR